VLIVFSVNCVFCVFLQYFDTVGWVFWPVKTVAGITYTVLVATLNDAQSTANALVVSLLGPSASSFLFSTYGMFTLLCVSQSGICLLQCEVNSRVSESQMNPRSYDLSVNGHHRKEAIKTEIIQ